MWCSTKKEYAGWTLDIHSVEEVCCVVYRLTFNQLFEIME